VRAKIVDRTMVVTVIVVRLIYEDDIVALVSCIERKL
jgi:hypothetical protein